MPPRRLLLCGAGGVVADVLATAALESGIREVVGVGPVRAPSGWPEAVAWIRLAGTAEGIAEALAERRPDAVVIFPWDPAPRRFPARGRGVDVARRVAEGCVTAGVSRLLLWSSTRVTDPAPPGRGPIPAGGELASRPAATGRRAAAVERVVRERVAARDGTGLVVLRAGHVLGREAPAELAGLPALPLLPRVRGADPPLQFLHEEDAVEILCRALGDLRPGTYDVAADGVVAWSELCRACRRPGLELPAPLWRALLATAWTTRLSSVPPTVVDLARRSWVVDNARLKTHVGYRPRFTARQALSAWLGASSAPGAQK